MHWMRHHWLLIMPLLLAILASCSSPGASTQHPTATPTIDSAHLTAFARSQPTYYPPTPTPIPPPLGPVPHDCPPGPTIRPIFSELGPGIGNAPLWAFGFGGPHPVLRINTSHDSYITPYGWIWKIIWEVGPHFSSTIILRGENVRTGAPIWFQLLDEPIVSPAVLDPQHPNHPVPAAGEGYAEWGSYIFIPVAGCYQIKATWPGGQWSFPFAAGRE